MSRSAFTAEPSAVADAPKAVLPPLGAQTAAVDGARS
jgi:hypothetical protein